MQDNWQFEPVAWTLLALVILHKKFADKKVEWDMAARKSVAYLRKNGVPDSEAKIKDLLDKL